MTTYQKIILATIVIAFVVLGIGFYISRPTTTPTTPATGTVGFPTGIGTGPVLGGGTAANGTTTQTGSNEAVGNATGTAPAFTPIIKQLTKNAVAGAIPLGTDSTIRYVERESGHIIDISPVTLEATSVSNTTIPRSQKATWSPDGGFVAYTTIGSSGAIENKGYIVPKSSKGGPVSIIATVFPKDAHDFVFSPDSKKVFYTKISGITTTGTVLDLTTLSEKKIFSSPLTEWNIEWATPRSILLTTKPSSGIEGFATTLDVATGGETRIVGGIPALSTLSSEDGAQLFITSAGQGKIASFFFDRKTEISGQSLVQTLPEKCVWSKLPLRREIFCASPEIWPSSALPDSWYKGTIATDDAILYLGANIHQIIMQPSSKTGVAPIDATHLMLDANEQFLYFINKLDGTLWSIQLYETKR